MTKKAIDIVLDEFMEISKIPRPSHNEEKISNYLYEWAKNKGLSVQKDSMGEIIIDKPASAGMESVPGIILQAHMDMVCVANEGIDYNPLTDPIKVINDGEYLYADGTSLGADDGIGVAICLYILQDTTLTHGPVRVILTTNEEDGMDSAMMEPKYLEGKYLINLDWETIGSLCNSCAGGDFFNFRREAKWEKPNNNTISIKLGYKDLLGGHSGIGIHKGHANALVTLSTLLSILKKNGVSYHIASFSGGNAKNAIPNNSQAEIVIAKEDLGNTEKTFEDFKKIFTDAFDDIEKEYMFIKNISDNIPDKVLEEEIGYSLIDLMTSVPNNVHTMSPFVEGLVESSSNLGVISVDDNEIFFNVFARSSVEYQGIQIGIICNILAERFGFTFDSEGHVPGWAVNPNSKLTEIACEAYKKITGEEMIVEPVHAGVECGAFAEKNPELDMISIGPTLTDVHTPDEKCKIADVTVIVDLIKEILEMIGNNK